MATGGGVRFVHTSDWQLGMTRHFLEGEAQARYAGARLDAVRAIGVIARERDCDFVVVAGDVFDSNLLSSQVVRRALDALASIDVPVFLLPGNHDALDASTVYRGDLFVAECPPGVRVLDGSGPVRVAPGVELIAAPLTCRAPLTDPAAAALEGVEADGTIRILVAHGPVDVLDPEDGRAGAIRLARLEQAIDEGVVHYVALGDRHSRLAVGGSGAVHYSGSPEVTAFRDRAAGDALIVDLPAAGRPRVEGVRVGAWRFVDVGRDVCQADDVASLDEELAAIPAAERTVVRHALLGSLSLTDHAALQEVLARHTDRFAGLFAWERHTDLAVYVDGAELTDLGVSGFVGAAVRRLGEQAGDEARAGDALALLYRLARTGTR